MLLLEWWISELSCSYCSIFTLLLRLLCLWRACMPPLVTVLLVVPCRCESGDDLVANVINRGEYEGLDLHAIASASIELPAGGPAAARQQQVALVPPSPAESAV